MFLVCTAGWKTNFALPPFTFPQLSETGGKNLNCATARVQGRRAQKPQGTSLSIGPAGNLFRNPSWDFSLFAASGESPKSPPILRIRRGGVPPPFQGNTISRRCFLRPSPLNPGLNPA